MSGFNLTEDQRDCLQELSNIAMGQAGDSLARFLEVFVHLSVPTIRLVSIDELGLIVSDISHYDGPVSAVRQGFYDAKGRHAMSGESVVVFNQTSQKELGRLMDYEEDLGEIERQEILLDVANILSGACLNGLAEQLEGDLSFSPPALIGENIDLKTIMSRSENKWTHSLIIEISYTFENHSFSCDMLLLMPDDSIEGIIQKVDKILEDL